MTCRDIITSENTAEFFVQNDDRNTLENVPPDCLQMINDKYSVAYYSIENIELLQTLNTKYSAVPKLYGLLNISDLEAAGISKVRTQPSLALKGRGVILGFIDTGIDYTHPAFINRDKTSRIVSIWDQTRSCGTPPSGFDYGSEYSKEQINEALMAEDPFSIVPSNDENGHGTYVAGVAGGNDYSLQSEYSGAAPLAELVMVKLKPAKKYLKNYFCMYRDVPCYQEDDIALAFRYLLDVAAREGKPLSICLSIGTNYKNHGSAGIIDELIDAVSGKTGICVTAAAGNENNTGCHYRGKLQIPPQQDSEIIYYFGETTSGVLKYDDVQLRIADNEPGLALTIWEEVPSLISVGLLSPSGEEIARIPARTDYSAVMDFVFNETKVYIDYEIIEQRTGEQHILLRFDRPIEGIWTIRIYFEKLLGGYYDIWLPMRGFISDETSFLRPDPNVTICDPGNSVQVITVTAYDAMNRSIYTNASRGYTRTGNIKPDIAAPGVNIYGPVPATGHAAESEIGNYTMRSGTCAAAAITAGAAALLLEYGIVNGQRPYMTGIEIKRLLIKGAGRMQTHSYPNREWGWGTLDVYEAIGSLRGTS